MKKKLLCILIAVAVFIPCAASVNAEQTSLDLLGVDFLDQCIFFGESTTAHLKQRSALRAEQVWTTASGTARLDSNLANRPILDPKTNQSATPVELAKRDQPQYMVLSFGLNGIAEFSKAPDNYLAKYQKLIDALKEVSPNTCFFIQSIYPVARDSLQKNWQFYASPTEINQRIELLNQSLKSYFSQHSQVYFVDTSCNLKDSNGFLRDKFTTDGIHLTAAAYEVILEEFRLYGYE